MASVNNYPLSTFTTGETVQLERIEIEGALKRRLLDLGFIPGASSKCFKKVP